MSIDDFDIEEILAALRKKAEEEDEDDDGDGEEPNDDEDQITLFPDEPTEVETRPDMGDTEAKLPPNTDTDDGRKFNEAFTHVLKKILRRKLMGKIASKLRKDPDDGVVPLRDVPFTKEQVERLDKC